MGAQLIRSVCVIAAVAAAAAPARGERRPGYGGKVVGSLIGEPASLDPAHASSHAEISMVGLLYDSLYRVDETGALQPHLAAGLPVLSNKRRVARIPIASGVAFHDGQVLSVADVVASLRRIQGSRGTGWLLAPVRRIRAGKDEVILELRRDTPELVSLLAAPQLSIVPGGKAPRADRVNGTGPFKLRAMDRKRGRVVVAAHDAHFAGRPYLDEVELRWFADADEEARRYERGVSHVSLRGAAAFSGHVPKYATDKVEGPATILVYVGFGTAQRAVTSDRDVRQALSFSLSRGGFKSVGTGERVVPSVFPDAVDIGGGATDRAQREARLDAANAALARARRRVRELRGPLELEVLIDRTRPDDRVVAEKVVAALYRVNVRARITAVPARSFADRVTRGACDLYVGHLATTVADPALATAAAFAVGRDDWTQRMLAKARLRADGARAWFVQRLPVVPLFHRAVRAHYRQNLRGVHFDSAARLDWAGLFEHGVAPLSRSRGKQR